MIEFSLVMRKFLDRRALHAAQPMSEAQLEDARVLISALCEVLNYELQEEKRLLRGRVEEVVGSIAALGGRTSLISERLQAVAVEVGSRQDEPGSLRARVKQLEHEG